MAMIRSCILLARWPLELLPSPNRRRCSGTNRRGHLETSWEIKDLTKSSATYLGNDSALCRCGVIDGVVITEIFPG